MTAPALHLADVISRFGPAFLASHAPSLLPNQNVVLRAIERCRTPAAGLHVEACDECGHTRLIPNSCRNRHCPRCQRLNQAQWVENQLADLLDVEYFHVVFTLPDEVASIALQNKRVVFNLLFSVASDTLRTIAADPRHLGADIGFIGVLHTWGQTLQFHPHLHCIVPGGGLSPDRSRFVRCRRGFFLPVRVLSRLFRSRFLEALRGAFTRGELCFRGSLTALLDPAAFDALLASIRAKQWVVYAKRPFGGPTQVVKYLGQYTHRIAIAESRLVSIDDTGVSFRWRDYRHEHRVRTMTLSGDEFLRRFLLHVLPRGFQRIRHVGLLSNRRRRESLALCRSLLGSPSSPLSTPKPADGEPPTASTNPSRYDLCPLCGLGRMRPLAWLPLPDPLSLSAPSPVPYDSS